MNNEIDPKDAKCTSLAIQAPVEMLKGDPEGKTADFKIEAYTGQVVDRWWGKLAIDVHGIKAKKQIPIFRDHNRGAIVGYSKKTWTDGSFFVSGNFSTATDHAREVKALAAEGFPWQASIGVMPKKILSLEEGAEHEVNGKKLKGPAEVWLQSEVYETSFVPLGADPWTSVSVFSRFEEATQPPDEGDQTHKGVDTMTEKQAPVALTIEKLRADHPDITAALLAEGAQSERDRIKAVLEQSMPGHEALVERLAFDGKTTGPEAAVQVLAAQKAELAQMRKDIRDSAPEPVHTPPAPDAPNGKPPSSASLETRTKWDWDNDAAIREEFGDYETYFAALQAIEAGRVKMWKEG